MRVLYVEDNPRDAEMVRHELARNAPEVTLDLASSAAEAYARLEEGPPYDLALIDLRLPGEGGVAVLREIRKRALPTAVIIITGKGSEETAMSALKAGADDYFSKSRGFPSQLLVTMETALARFRAEASRLSNPLSVLYAEHHAIDIDLTRRHFETYAPHIRLEVVHSTREVLERLSDNAEEPCRYDVLLLDYRLPGESALELLKTLHDRQQSNLPVVLVTGQGDEEIAVQALRLGAADYLSKHPGYLHELPVALENACHRAKLSREQAALRESHEQLDSVIESAMDALISVDASQRIVLFNAAAEKMFRCGRGEAIGEPLERFLPERFRAAHRDQVESFALSGQTRRTMGKSGLVNGLRADGEEFPAEASIFRTSPAGGILLTVTLRDVTRRLRAERDLSTVQEQLQHAVDAGNVGLWSWDLQTNKVLYSSSWKRQIGYEDDEVSDDREEWRGRVHPADLAGAMAASEECLAGHSDIYSTQFRFRHKDGTYRNILATGRVSIDEQGRPLRLIGSHIDLTEHFALESQFRHAQKMVSVGRLAGGVAHDFNNLLTIINSYADLALAELLPADPVFEMIKEIGAAGDRAAHLTRQLLAFSSQQVVESTVFDLGQVVSEMKAMLQRLLGADVLLTVEVDSSVGHVRADVGQIEQVVMNLAVNARDAMSKGGRLTITVANADIEESEPGDSVPAGPFVLLRVQDAGVGMDRETLEHIFEPFFTTKGKNEGTGLGLATVHGIVGQSGGHIKVESERGSGTVFEILLPRVDDAVSGPTLPAAAPAVGGDGTILIVDDQRAVREVMRRILESAGYEILAAPSGDDALNLLASVDRPIQLLITDLVMPGISGMELARRLRESHPELKVLLTSGFSEERTSPESFEFLGKPFTVASLTQKVSKILPVSGPPQTGD